MTKYELINVMIYLHVEIIKLNSSKKERIRMGPRTGHRK